MILNLFAPIVMAVSVLLAGSAYAQEDQRVADAKVAATAWLALVDAGQYADSWSRGASAFRTAVTQEKWQQAGMQVRTPLGAMTARTFKSAQFSRTLPGAPDGEYVVIEYATTYANKPDATETVIPMRDRDGTWKVAGWFIR